MLQIFKHPVFPYQSRFLFSRDVITLLVQTNVAARHGVRRDCYCHPSNEATRRLQGASQPIPIRDTPNTNYYP